MKYGSMLAAACLLAASAPTSHAAPPPAEAFYKDADVAEAVLSPSGRRLAVTTAKGTPRVSLAVYDLAPGGKNLRVAQFPEADVMNVRWVNDERLVFGVTDYSAGSGRPAGAPGLFTVKTDGSPVRQLVRRQFKATINDGRDDRMLDWNHRLVAVPPSRPGKVNEEVLLMEYAYGSERSETPVWLNTATNIVRGADYKPPVYTAGWAVDSLGEPRIAFTQHEGRVGAFWRADPGKPWARLYDSPLGSAPFHVEGIDDNGVVLVSHPQGPRGVHVLSRLDTATGQPEAKPLIAVPGFDFAGELVTDENGRTLGVRVHAEAESTVWFDEAMKAFQQRADALLPGRVNRIDCRRCGTPDMVALVRSYSDRNPGQIYLFQAKPPEGERNWRLFRAVRPDIRPDQMAALEFQRIRARDGQDLPVWVTRPTDAQGPLPAVVLVHGGPWMRGGSWQWSADAQFLASRGYLVIEPEFRGSAGYGSAHLEAGFRQWGQAMQDDVTDALRWAQKEGLASDKACIAGASYGGYSALMGLIRDPSLYRCGVAWLAVTDLELLVNGAWGVDDDLGRDFRRHVMPERVGDPVKDAEMLAAQSPLRQAARLKAPVLLAFGEQDQRVPLAHGKRLRDALRAAGNEPAWVSYTGEAHGFAVLANRVDFAQRMEAFLAKYLQP